MRSRPPSREQAEFKPVIAELLRTCHYPPTLLLRVERLLEDAATTIEAAGRGESTSLNETGGNSSRRVPRLYLSDGELMIQAILCDPLQQLLRLEDIRKGALLHLRKYKLARADRLNGAGHVVYIAIEDLDVVGATAPLNHQVEIGSQDGGFIRDEGDGLQNPQTAKRRLQGEFRNSLSHTNPLRPLDMELAPSSQESDGFETAQVDLTTVSQRRQALKELKDNDTQVEKSQQEVLNPRKRRRVAFEEVAKPTIPTSIKETAGHLSIPRPSTPRTQPDIPLHNLMSLINPPSPLPARNYTCSVLAAISWISPSIIHKNPFPPKRLIKIHDPSLAPRHPGISLAIFVDARTFVPKTGTIALFKGVTMQRWEGEVILNAYASLKDKDYGWYIDDIDELRGLGHDVEGIKNWWQERSSKKGS